MNEGPITAVGQHRPLKVEKCRPIDTSLWITRDPSIAISPMIRELTVDRGPSQS